MATRLSQRARLHDGALPAVAVAVAIVVTALSNGGYGAQFTAGAGALLWWTIALALLAAGERRIPRAAAFAVALLAGFAAWTLASALWAPDAARALAQAAKAVAYLGALCAVVLASRRQAAGNWVAGLGAGLVIVAVIALAARFFPGLAADRDSLQAALPQAPGRLGFPVGYWNGLAALMAMAIVILAAQAGTAARPLTRVIATSLIPLPVLAIFLGSSRGGAVAAALGLGVLLALSHRRAVTAAGLLVAAPGALLSCAFAADQEGVVRGLDTASASDQGLALLGIVVLAVGATAAARVLLDDHVRALSLPRRLVRPSLAALGVALIVGVAAADPAARWQQFKDPPDFSGSPSTFVARHLQSGNGNGRYQFWEAATNAFADHPVAGLGAGGFEPYWAREGSIEYLLRDAHSILFETASELGLVGLALLLGFLGAVTAAGLRRARGSPAGDLGAAAVLLAVFATALVAVLIDWTWELPAVALPLLIAAGVLTGSGTLTGTGRERGIVVTRRGPLGLALLVTAAGAIIVCGTLFLGETQLERSRSLAAEGELTEAAEAAERAEALAPWAAPPLVQQALIAESLGDVAAAREEIAAAIERSAEDWRLRVVAARLALEAGDESGAREALAAARRLSPRSSLLAPRPPPPGLIPPQDRAAQPAR